MDFATVEAVSLERLQAGRIPELFVGLRVLLIDEYQDTNPLQERIYFEIARRTGGRMASSARHRDARPLRPAPVQALNRIRRGRLSEEDRSFLLMNEALCGCRCV